MPRPPRIDFPDALYHVTSRGNGRADIFWSDDDRQRFVGQLAHHLRLEEIDAAVSRHYRVAPGTVKAHGRRAGAAKAVPSQ